MSATVTHPEWTGGVPQGQPTADERRGIQHAGDGGLELTFNTALIDGWDIAEPPPAEVGELGLSFESLVVWMSGHFASGKSTITAAICGEWIAEQRHVFWLDWEVSGSQAKQRLRAAGIDKAMAHDYLHVALRPTLPANSRAAEALFNQLADAAGGEDQASRSLVVLDSYTKAHARSGARESEQDNTAVSQWVDHVVLELKRRGVTVIVIDHPPKNHSDENPYVGRGGGAKADDADLAYFAVAEVPFKRDQVGRVKLVCHKDRESVIELRGGPWNPSKKYPNGVRYFKVGDAEGKLPVTPIEAPAEAADDDGLSKADRGALAILGVARLAHSKGQTLSTAELAKAADLDPRSSSFKAGKRGSGALDVALRRGYVERVSQGVYKPGPSLNPPSVGNSATAPSVGDA